MSRALRPRGRRGEPRQDVDRSARQEELLAAAIEVIREAGPAASMDAMAARAGITKPILYRHFGDREGLLGAVAGRFADRLVERLEDSLGGEEEPRAQLHAAIEAYVRFIEEDLGLYSFLVHHAAAAGPVVMGVVDRVAAPVARAIGEALRRAGVDSGPAEVWAYGLVGMVHMAGMRWVASPTLPLGRLTAYLEALAWEGMAGFAGLAPEASQD